jgi:hypothetical protein
MCERHELASYMTPNGCLCPRILECQKSFKIGVFQGMVPPFELTGKMQWADVDN